jgi:hypothetical protein
MVASRDPREVASWLSTHSPDVVAVDSPRSPAADGERSRAGEREFVAARICSLRYTPDRRALSQNPTYYEWIEVLPVFKLGTQPSAADT